MLPLVLSLGFVAPLEVPDRAPTPVDLNEREITAVLQASESCFVAENLSHTNQILFLGSEEIGLAPLIRLAPGARLVFPYPRGSAEDLFVELLALDQDSWRNSGALALEAVHHAHHSSVWMSREADGLTSWIDSAAGSRSLAPQADLLPPVVIHAGGPKTRTRVSAAPSTPTHVPVPVPKQKGSRRGKPPVIEKKPLPPV